MSPPDNIIAAAINAGMRSPCQKSARGVAIWGADGFLEIGWNHQPEPFHCDGSELCRSFCNKLCVHAETHAIVRAGMTATGKQMLHIKVVDGKGVPSGDPSCWQCSRQILSVGIKAMWLLHGDGWKVYEPARFHDLSARTLGIHYESKSSLWKIRGD